MRVAVGLKAHSGWAALVAVGRDRGSLRLVERRRVELVEPENAGWAKQPYHAAEDLGAAEARALVRRGIEAARRVAVREIRGAVERLRESGHLVAGFAVLTGGPMPDWTTDQILAAHVRMHKAEGALFPDALALAAEGFGLPVVRIPEKELRRRAEETLGAASAMSLIGEIAALRKAAGPPWRADQKNATLAVVTAFSSSIDGDA